MRLRSFTAATASKAMELCRERLGPDAIIMSTATGVDGNTVVFAATDDSTEEVGTAPAGHLEDGTPIDCSEVIQETLLDHGTPPDLAERLIGAAIEQATEDPAEALAGALETVFRFEPLIVSTQRPLIVAGPPGAGKTSAVAKLAARAVLDDYLVRLFSTDTVRAGSIEQLAAFARVLGVPLHRVDNVTRLRQALEEMIGTDVTVIDTAGINPYNGSDRAEAGRLIAGSGAEPVFVVPAGGDAYDTTEMARIFADLGCRRMLVTRLDMVRRLGSILAAADTADLAFCDVGVSPDIAEGLVSLSPLSLARFLLSDPTTAHEPILLPERVST